MWHSAMWIGVPQAEVADKKVYFNDMTGRFAYFRHSFSLEEAGRLTIAISANTRYRLWVNGIPVASGPCKGDQFRHYYDIFDISEHLVSGKNTVSVQVLYQEPHSAVRQTDERASIYSVCGVGGGHRLAVEGSVQNDTGQCIHDLTTGCADWRVWLEGSYYLRSSSITEYLGAVCEEIDCKEIPQNWKLPNFDDAAWEKSVPLEPVKSSDFMSGVGLIQRLPIRIRPIPQLYETQASFVNGTDAAVTVPPGTSKQILLDAGAEVNGYPVFRFQGGAGSRVEITYFEKFTGACASSKTDVEHGEISGLTDKLVLSGGDMTFEPFWYRTFRFTSVSITTANAVTFLSPVYRKTGYPLKAESWIRSSEPWVEEVWSMCVRTLENCMMDTYMDCPYYEQNQFPMDTRLEALFCAAVSRDDQLTRKALEDFHCSITPDGLVHGRYPSVYPQIISTFSLHYIFMLEEHWRQTGEFNRRYMPDIDRILEYYQNRVEDTGLVGRLGYWEFIDWQAAWAHLGGIPEALEHGPSTIINLMYALALEKGAALVETSGRAAVAEEYRMRRRDILRRVEDLCWDENRNMFREGPEFAQYSQHAQSWAVLNGLLQGERAVMALRRSMCDTDVLKCSFSTSFEWFRALELAGIYPETFTDMKRWADLPALGNTTCPETPGDSRSECHAWSALPIYEFIRVIAGIRENCGALEIRPNPAYLPDVEGAAVTRHGLVRFRYIKQNGLWQYEITLPENVQAMFIAPNGDRHSLTGRQIYKIRGNQDVSV